MKGYVVCRKHSDDQNISEMDRFDTKGEALAMLKLYAEDQNKGNRPDRLVKTAEHYHFFYNSHNVRYDIALWVEKVK